MFQNVHNNSKSRPMITNQPTLVDATKQEVSSSRWQKTLRTLVHIKAYFKARFCKGYKELQLASRTITPVAMATPLFHAYSIRGAQPGKWKSTISQGVLNEVKINTLRIAMDIISDKSSSSEQLSSLHKEMNNEVQNLLTANKQAQAHNPVTDKNILSKIKKYPNNLKKRLTAAGIPKAELKGLIKAKYITQLHQKEWKNINKTIEVAGLGKLKSDQIPAAKIQINPESSTDMFPVSYHKHGIPSPMTTSSDHAVNLWTSSLSSDTGKVLYQGVRHAIHSAFGLKGKDRKEANLKRAKESLLTALQLKPDLLKKALSDTEKPVHIDCASISLLTPDWIRSGSSNEKKMLLDQVTAFESLSSSQPIKLDIIDQDGNPQTIQVTTRLLCFNFGVNRFAVNPILSDVIGGWGPSDAINQKGLEALIGEPKKKVMTPNSWVGAYLKESRDLIEGMKNRQKNATPSDSQKLEKAIVARTQKCKIIQELEQQIRTIYKKKHHHHDRDEAYKMPARIVLLTHLLNGVPLSNCKSGKDRTGMLDVEVKFLATRCEKYGAVPEAGAPLSDEDREIFQSILLNSGNLEIQEYNTGLQGFKTRGVKSIKQRTGDKEVLREVTWGTYAIIS